MAARRAPGSATSRATDTNLESLEFFHHLSSVLRRRDPGALLIAEDSSISKDVTLPPEQGGIGFSLKWNMGWMHDFLDYLALDPIYRQYHHEKMTYTLSYAFLEQYILPLSHDEVVHLKKPMVYKIPGNMEDKLGCLKTAYCWMLGHPGKKLLFMGQDFAETSEWMEDRSLDWQLADETGHRDVMEAVRRMLQLYRSQPALWDDRPGDLPLAQRPGRRGAAASALCASPRRRCGRDAGLRLQFHACGVAGLRHRRARRGRVQTPSDHLSRRGRLVGDGAARPLRRAARARWPSACAPMRAWCSARRCGPSGRRRQWRSRRRRPPGRISAPGPGAGGKRLPITQPRIRRPAED